MKSRITLVAVSLLASLIVGAVFLQMQGQSLSTINVVWNPKSYTWDSPPPDPWYAELWRQKVQTTLDPSTIRLEGIYSPSGPVFNATHGPRLIVPFHGAEVQAAIFAKLPTNHMGILVPGTYRISLVITGTLYSGEQVQGDGAITVTVLPPSP